MSHRHIVASSAICALIAAMAQASFAAPVVSSVPGSIDRFEPAAVQVSVSGLSGTDLHLRLLIDLNANGSVDAGDEPIWSGLFIDNGTTWSPTMPADSDPTIGTITVDLRLFHPLGFPYTSGNFLWQAEDASDFSTDAIAFTVTQDLELQSVSGRITLEGSTDPVPGAIVALLPLSEECQAPELTAVTDLLGDYVIQVPDGLPCSNRLVVPIKPGFVAEFIGGTPLEFSGDDLFVGVDRSLAPGLETASGSLLYEDGPRIGEGIAGVMVFADSQDDTLTLAFTDIDGSYTLALSDGDWQVEPDNKDQLALQGAVLREDTRVMFNVAGASATIPDILIPAVNAVIRGTLFGDIGIPMAGERVEMNSNFSCSGDCFSTRTVTDANGDFVLGVVAPVGPEVADYIVGPRVPLEGLVATRIAVALSQDDDLGSQDLAHLLPSQFITGTFTDTEGDPVGDLCIWADVFGPEMYVSRARVDCDGTYVLPVIDGQWNVRFSESELLSLYRGVDATGVQEQITIEGEDEQLNVVLGRASFLPTITGIDPPEARAGDHVVIEGSNFGTSPPPLVFFGGFPANVIANRPDLARLLVEVPAGVAPGPVTVSFTNQEAGGVASNSGCFEVLQGTPAPTCSITGTLSRNAGTVLYEDGIVVAIDSATGVVKRLAVSDASGNYALDLDDASATYDLIVVSSASTLRVWGSFSGVACPTVQDHVLHTGRLVSGRVIGSDGGGLAGVRVEAEGALSFAENVTDDLGEFVMRMEQGDDVEFDFSAPIGSRHVNNQTANVTINNTTILPDVQLSTGSLFSGRVLGSDGDAARVSIVADSFSGGGPGGSSLPDTCTGAFTIALASGVHDLRLQNEREQSETRVESLDIGGDEVSEFAFTTFDATLIPFSGPEPRLNDNLDPRGQVGQPIFVGVENLADVGVTAQFTAGGFLKGNGVLGEDTVSDPARGLLITRVPSGAGSGDFVVDVQGTSTPAYPFTVLPGIWDTGSLTLSGSVIHSATPVEGALVVLLRSDPFGPGCDGDALIHDYVLTDASGAFSLTHPGGDLFILVLPPRGPNPARGSATPTDLAPLALEFPAEAIDRTGVVADLATGVAVSLHSVSAATVPSKTGAGVPSLPVPNAIVFIDGSVSEFGLTDATGSFTTWLPPGPYEIEIGGPHGSRFVATARQATAPSDLGDVVLDPGFLVSGRLADTLGDPVFGAFIRGVPGFGGGEDLSFFDVTTRQAGLWSGAVPAATSFEVGIDTGRNDLSDSRFDHYGGILSDLIHYPSDVAVPAGMIEGTVVDASGLTPLPFVGLTTLFDEFGAPGATSGGRQTCEDGTYRVKVAEGAHFVAALPDLFFDLFPGWYSPGTPADFCFGDAESVFVASGTTVSGIDIRLDLRSGIAGSVTAFGNPEPGLNINITEGQLGSCRVDAFTDGGGNYNAEVPSGPGYRVEAQSPPSIGGLSQCWDREPGCATFTPIDTEPLETSVGINFEFGFAPSEVSATFPELTVQNIGGGMITLTFEKRPSEDHADTYNSYSGTLTDFDVALQTSCFLDPLTFVDNGNGTYSHTFIPDAGSEWFLVSASNGVDEGPLGNNRVLSNSCGPVP